jgi:hypothetical protein
MNRRGFLKGFAALAAVAVAPTIPAALVRSEIDRLMAKIATGVVENETFYLDGGIVLQGMKGLIINHCRFVFRQIGENEPFVTVGDGCDRISITNCAFHAQNVPTGRIQDLVTDYAEGPISLGLAR